ncbi:hypothetical protein COU16_01860 [Candidatus Kaiserbacteria bacterium CG10_big_fil_rev_8_21_14_0_10_47_16]|uniref:Uncharacterized protein n=1 Tax=Candidatus Kaiserbacteria bacterium CG10_big_fil_rev_8_21_14_0_10_47_16 TaxID=1974608 RepID=A0A2H0UD93_9BACT|nr:MAG: hypothetical protein COU16_01860 [Candidatus Kaiserbacteria bacterium CG10_big_fil_rev_8_21_14_0_10_47_16]
MLGTGAVGLALVASPLHCRPDVNILKQHERVLMTPSLQSEVAEVTRTFGEIAGSPLSDASINAVLMKFDCGCDDVTPAKIRDNPTLLREVGFIYFIELVNTYGLDEAKQRYKTQR